jgi:hypothetical protein
MDVKRAIRRFAGVSKRASNCVPLGEAAAGRARSAVVMLSMSNSLQSLFR